VRFVILLAILWGGFNLVGTLADKVEDATREITIPNLDPPTPEITIPSLDPPTPEITIPSLDPPTPADEPTGLAAGSLLRPAAFQRAMADIRRRDIGRIQTLRLAPERIDPTLLTPKGTLVAAQVSSGGEFRRFSECRAAASAGWTRSRTTASTRASRSASPAPPPSGSASRTRGSTTSSRASARARSPGARTSRTGRSSSRTPAARSS
jgi:hypothetical protein